MKRDLEFSSTPWQAFAPAFLQGPAGKQAQELLGRIQNRQPMTLREYARAEQLLAAAICSRTTSWNLDRNLVF